MFGSPVTISASPLLRRATSKHILSDPGEASSVNVLVASLEENEMKTLHSSIPGISVIPSPDFLWRFKVVLFLIWGLCCCKTSWDSVMRMSADKRDLFLYEAFLYYNPLLLVTMMVWLWGVNLLVFAQSSVNYAKIFDLDLNHLTHREIWKSATWMTIVVPTSMAAYLYLYSHGEVSLAASQPVYYLALLLILADVFRCRNSALNLMSISQFLV